MKSMTGYAKISYECPYGTIEVEIKSVNNRFLHINYRSPRIFESLEHSITRILKEKIFRGSVIINFRFFPNPNTSIIELLVDKVLAKKYYEYLCELKEEFNLNGEIYPATFLYCSNVFYTKEKEIPEIKEYIFEALNICLKQYDEFRIEEGKNLKKQIKKCIRKIKNILKELEEIKDSMIESYIEKAKRRMEKFAKKYGEISEERLLQEALLYADKGDISEEIVRLESHIKEMEKTINKKGSIGKKLDFIAQECLREANTIGSKANQSKISMLSIELKCEIEKIREQVQNIE